MTAAETLDRDNALYVTDAELIRRLGVPEKVAYPVLRELDAKKCGFPPKQALWGNLRYWPAVRAYLDRTSGLNMTAQPPQGSHHVR